MADADPAPVAEAHRYPCAECGADLRFAPGQTRLRCDHCGHLQDIPADDAPAVRHKALGELDYQRALQGALPEAAMQETRVTSCPNCGAQVQFDGAAHATQCPFCATPVVSDTGTQRQIKPQALVPFVLEMEQARGAMSAWLGRLWFAPNGLRDYARKGRALDGLYVPYWTYDADSRSRYTGQRGEHYYETRTVTVTVNGRSERRQEQVQKTRWYPASGTVARQFDDVLAMASTSLPQGYADGLEPWDLSALTAYRPDYLAGFGAEGYMVSLEDGHGIARAKMDRVIEGDVRRDIGGDVQQISSVDTTLSDQTFKHVLLPVWMAAYKYRGRTFRFIVNGQTGKVQGERPWSAWKIGFAVVLGLIVAGVAAYVYTLNQG